MDPGRGPGRPTGSFHTKDEEEDLARAPLVYATLLNLFVVPTLYLRFGRRRNRDPMSGQMAVAGD